MCVVAIHQPNYLPWVGTFFKIARCDQFVVLDDAQYSKHGYINRNRIKTPSGPTWLSIPVQLKGRFGARICDLPVDMDDPWLAKHRKTLQANYARTPHFRAVMDAIIDPVFVADRPHTTDLAAFNTELMRRMARFLDIETPMVAARSLRVTSCSTQRLIELVGAVGGTTYLSGRGADKYQDVRAFEAAGLALRYNDFERPQYDQPWGDFVPDLSAMDLLFSCGRSAGRWFRRSARTKAGRKASAQRMVAG